MGGKKMINFLLYTERKLPLQITLSRSKIEKKNSPEETNLSNTAR